VNKLDRIKILDEKSYLYDLLACIVVLELGHALKGLLIFPRLTAPTVVGYDRGADASRR
jgi:hypothetical protein